MYNLIKLIAPAKVNLVLAVGDKRSDGFHSVDTIMHALSLHDTLTMRRFEEDEGGLTVSLTCETAGTIPELDVEPGENIVSRAIVMLADELDRACDEHFEVQLQKSIPAEAGLGGGSSDAAAALIGASMFWEIEPTSEPVLRVASRLGADVPFFLHGGCVRLTGKGEEHAGSLEPRRGFVLLLRPDAGVSTKAAYAAFDAAPEPPSGTLLAELARHTAAESVVPWNNLERAACTVTPEVAEVLAWGRALPGGGDVVLCGSGSAVCVMFPSYDEACQASIEAHKQGWWSRVTSFSPLGASVLKAL